MDDLKIDAAGTVWGHVMTSDGARFFKSWSPNSGSEATYQVCNPDRLSALPLELSPYQTFRICKPRYPDDWAVQPGKGIAFSSGAELFALDKEGTWTHRIWDGKLRGIVSNALDLAMPRAKTEVIHFGDGLFWHADHDGFGIDPRTARVAQAVVTSPEGMFFGSISAGWGLGFSTQGPWFDFSIYDWRNPHHFRVVDLATGKPRLDVKTGAFDDYNYHIARYGVARSAHGQLLAISGTSPRELAIVLDMKEGKPLATLRAPHGYMIDAMAFSWRGDKLWLYARKAGASGGRKMIISDIPAGLADAASGTDTPDQLSFSFSDVYSCIGCAF